ncbi:hypothetical protein JYP52_21325 [Nitratireductor aquibiodomus]|uniref:hypothetical protein n=1 Tax=Nitratireductor aquibiodomus TaxID=204799 RepID=UPI0019D3BF3C|nr:hypothetical protein [Nitratireductor aquibiodomus]MBN7763683.1 hypothetical protein [Nitratireductor aquibiodomus]
MKTLNHYIILWKIDAEQDFCFEADMSATGPCAAKAQFAELFPNDIIVGVKSARSADGWF